MFSRRVRCIKGKVSHYQTVCSCDVKLVADLDMLHYHLLGPAAHACQLLLRAETPNLVHQQQHQPPPAAPAPASHAACCFNALNSVQVPIPRTHLYLALQHHSRTTPTPQPLHLLGTPQTQQPRTCRMHCSPSLLLLMRQPGTCCLSRSRSCSSSSCRLTTSWHLREPRPMCSPIASGGLHRFCRECATQ
jgi:hypothetical protein